MRILFIGGPGNISESAIRALQEEGHAVSVFTLPTSPDLGMEGRVRFIRGDRDRPGELAAATAAEKPDVVVDTVCFTSEQARTAAAAYRGRTGRLVFVSTVDAYGYPLSRLPMGEDDERRPPVSPYAAEKAACESIFREAAADGAFCLTIARPAYSFGRAFVLDFFSRSGGPRLISRLRAGLPLVVPGDGSERIHVSVAWNTGRMLAALASSDRSDGKSYNCAHEHSITRDDYYRLFARAVGAEPRLVHIPTELLLPLEKRAIPDNLLSELSRFQLDFSVASFRRDFPEFRWERSLTEGAADYVRFRDAGPGWPKAVPDWEDRAVQAWKDCASAFSARFAAEAQ